MENKDTENPELVRQETKRASKEDERKAKLEVMRYDFVHISTGSSKEGPIYLFKRELPIGTTYIKKHGPYWQVYCLKSDKNNKIKVNGKTYDSEYHKELRLAMKVFHGKIKAHLQEVEYAVDCMHGTLRDTEV